MGWLGKVMMVVVVLVGAWWSSDVLGIVRWRGRGRVEEEIGSDDEWDNKVKRKV